MGIGRSFEVQLICNWQVLLHDWPKSGHGELSQAKQSALGRMCPPRLLGTGASLIRLGTVVILLCLWKEVLEARIKGYLEGWLASRQPEITASSGICGPEAVLLQGGAQHSARVW